GARWTVPPAPRYHVALLGVGVSTPSAGETSDTSAPPTNRRSRTRSQRVTASDPLLTILVPCRDVEPDYFRQAIASVQAQTSPRWRLCIAVDAADSGATAALLATPGPWRDPRACVVHSPRPRVTATLNAGLRHLTTPYVAILHADDLLADCAVEILEHAIAQHPEVDYFHSSRLY